MESTSIQMFLQARDKGAGACDFDGMRRRSLFSLGALRTMNFRTDCIENEYTRGNCSLSCFHQIKLGSAASTQTIIVLGNIYYILAAVPSSAPKLCRRWLIRLRPVTTRA